MLRVRVLRCQKLQMTAQPGLAQHRMLYSCTHMATAGIKGKKRNAASCHMTVICA